jgi:hypothetical protein
MCHDVTTQGDGPVPDPTGTGAHEDPTAGAKSVPVPHWGRRRWSVLVTLAAVALLVAWGPWRAQGDVRDGTTVVDRAGLAARHGIDVDLVAVTAAGGLVELRMQVTDPDKANAVIHEPADRPVLVAEDTGQTLAMSAPPHHKANLELGREYFFLLANAHNALRPGSEVTVVVDDVRLEHVEVQG